MHGEDCLCGSSCVFPDCDDPVRIPLRFHEPQGQAFEQTIRPGSRVDFCSDEHVKAWAAALAGVSVSEVSFELVAT